ncbi:hypothetical protein DFH06DRAFT_1392286 [Mycena polygramma]|nr:hypothetical protein DFH06DRAFT_1392286 [Mycena polygramma]
MFPSSRPRFWILAQPPRPRARASFPSTGARQRWSWGRIHPVAARASSPSPSRARTPLLRGAGQKHAIAPRCKNRRRSMQVLSRGRRGELGREEGDVNWARAASSAPRLRSSLPPYASPPISSPFSSSATHGRARPQTQPVVQRGDTPHLSYTARRRARGPRQVEEGAASGREARGALPHTVSNRVGGGVHRTTCHFPCTIHPTRPYPSLAHPAALHTLESESSPALVAGGAREQRIHGGGADNVHLPPHRPPLPASFPPPPPYTAALMASGARTSSVFTAAAPTTCTFLHTAAASPVPAVARGQRSPVRSGSARGDHSGAALAARARAARSPQGDNGGARRTTCTFLKTTSNARTLVASLVLVFARVSWAHAGQHSHWQRIRTHTLDPPQRWGRGPRSTAPPPARGDPTPDPRRISTDAVARA